MSARKFTYFVLIPTIIILGFGVYWMSTDNLKYDDRVGRDYRPQPKLDGADPYSSIVSSDTTDQDALAGTWYDEGGVPLIFTKREEDVYKVTGETIDGMARLDKNNNTVSLRFNFLGASSIAILTHHADSLIGTVNLSGEYFPLYLSRNRKTPKK